MFSNRQNGIARLFFILQQVGVVALLWIVYPLVNGWRFDGSLPVEHYLEATFLLLAAALVEYFTREPGARHLSGLSRQRLVSISHRQTLFGLTTIFGTMVMFKDDSLSRAVLLVFFAAYFVWISWTNQFGHRLLHRALYHSDRKGLARTLVVGEPGEVGRFCSNEESPQPPGTHLLGFVPVGPQSATLPMTLPVLGHFSDLRSICEETRARALLLLGIQDRRDLVRPLTSISSELGLRTVWIDDVKAGYGSGFEPYHTGRFSVVSRLREPLEDPANRAVKRLFDLAASTFGIVFVLPPALLLTVVLQRLHSPGPVFYRQARSGRNEEPFHVLKFRTMEVAEDEFSQARAGDTRVFPGGAFLRKASIDELPQLLNVFLGDMSLVGPRPHPLPLDRQLADRSPTYRLRNLAKPGITGLAQCRGWRGETRSSRQLRNRIHLDLFYIQHWSLGLDLRIIAATAWQLLKPPRSAC
ncbi:MAG: exopolysaccharide biosynthesis polyprenyl glycosylphosphotransferase [Verrucomicrobiales bacterium]